MREAALFLEARAAALVERALMRKQAFLPAGQEHGVEFQPLGGMQRHDVDGLLGLRAVAVHHQRDVLEEALQVLEFLHGAHQLLEVFQPAGGVGGAVLLPHLGVAGFIEHDFGELGVRQLILLRAPALECGHQVAQRQRAASASSRRWREGAGGFGERDAFPCARSRAASAAWRRRGRAWAR